MKRAGVTHSPWSDRQQFAMFIQWQDQEISLFDLASVYENAGTLSVCHKRLLPINAVWIARISVESSEAGVTCHCATSKSSPEPSEPRSPTSQRGSDDLETRARECLFVSLTRH